MIQVHRARQTIKRQTRLDIFDGLRIHRVPWAGDLSEVQFLERIWDLSSLPSNDYRYSDAAGDIYQHRINNYDWDDDWIYADERFDLLGCNDQTFVQFCTNMLHPAVRSDTTQTKEVAALLNDTLAADGWELAPDRKIGGLATYRARRVGERDPVVVEPTLHEKVADPALFDEHLRRIRAGLQDDPPTAIGSAKELVETTCRVILDSEGVGYRPADDLLALYKAVAKQLHLNAESVPDDVKGSQAAQSALRSLSATVQNLAEMRNALGTGHGRGRRSKALARHARLAVTTAEALCRFLLDTWHDRRGD
jgi:hypothetical protein